ncbi:hypothetical protein [Corynebacterium sp.]|uniref:hypothetical protein n=1 Tax=Corynebacterium sp. TaxID=1720 RepID=UPI0028AB8844|nr:hypothetical protein [Corynebacterium sp.]
MISTRPQPYTLTDEIFNRSLQVIQCSGAVDLVESYHAAVRGPGGRPCRGQRFTLLAVLVVGLAVLRVGRAPSVAEVFRVIGTLTPAQLAAVGMDPDEVPEPGARQGGYPAFHGWLTRLLSPLDSGADLPARRVSNKEHKQQIAERSAEQVKASETARCRLHEVVNAIVAASVEDKLPVGYAGDIIADETIVDLAGPSDGLGTKEDKYRSAAYMARYYVRDGSDNSVRSRFGDVVQFKKSAVGIGVTAVSRVGAPDDLYGVPTLITGISIHPPTSGSVEGLAKAIAYHQKNGFDQRTKRGRLPYLTTDMGYNVKKNFTDMVLEHGYAPVVRYPRHWNTVFASEGPEHARGGKVDGPVQISGDFYCPAARQIIGKQKLVRKMADLLKEEDGFEVQDRRLEAVFPLLMGTNSRPYRARVGRGRPRKDEPTDASAQPVRQDLVCPAVQGRVQCPLKPASMGGTDLGIPTVTPTWTADRYRCCSQSQVTVTLSKDQWRMAQWGMVPGSWEHALYFEAARAATEQRFSIMKSQHVTGIEHLKWSPRREPMLCLLIGLWVAATNLAIQDVYDQRPPKPSSVKKKMRELEADLGRPPTRIPPRT